MYALRRKADRDFRPAIGWLIVGLPIVALLLRFVMRALGVRPDVPFPGMIYSLTAPLVEPFYRFLPNNPHFDTGALEPASLLAAIAVFVVAVFVYLISFLVLTSIRGSRS